MSIVFCIPARINSSRIKEKMLIEFEGKPLIQNVFESVESFGFPTFVITDSKKISNHIPSQNTIMSGKAENGTARIASVLDKLPEGIIINIQGDMLGVSKETVSPIIEHPMFGSDYLFTAYKKGYNPDGVKIIHQNGLVSWFTRKDIGYGDHHLGIYSYTKKLLRKYSSLKSIDEGKEDLEQLRFLRYFPMYALEVKYQGKEINILSDI